MSKQPRYLVVLLSLGLAPVISGNSQELSGDDMRSLDGQVQEIKSDVLDIASGLNVLEERLLYPSGTQLAVFVSLDGDQDFRLDALQIDINGEPATHHIYSFKELEALQKGGVQRVHTSNVVTGTHEITVTMLGKLENGEDFSDSESFAFTKGVKPKALGVTLSRGGFGTGGIQVGDW